MQLNRAELAQSFRVSLNTITSWVHRGCPRLSAGERGQSMVFEWAAGEELVLRI